MKPRFNLCIQCETLLILGLALCFITIYYLNKNFICPASDFFYPLLKTAPLISQPFSTQDQNHFSHSITNISHLVFGLLASEKAWHYRKSYIESWWQPNITRGFIFLDKSPTKALLPWPETSPPYKISDNLTEMGDDDSVFFVDNMVDVLGKLDHSKYYYLGGNSENIVSNYLFSFNQAFGGGGIMLSYPVAKALARDMENCLKRYVFLNSADNTTRACIADIGANLSPQQGNHQIDLHGDISGLLSSHPQSPLISLHHFDIVDPIFPSKDRFESTRHLMKAAKADQSRMLQQTICYHRPTNLSFSISWGYSAHIYEGIKPRSYLQIPIETLNPWIRTPRPPYYLFNTRRPSRDPCEAPHVFFFDSVVEVMEDRVKLLLRAMLERGLVVCRFVRLVAIILLILLEQFEFFHQPQSGLRWIDVNVVTLFESTMLRRRSDLGSA